MYTKKSISITYNVELILIQKVNEAYERILNSDVQYRFVIDLKSRPKINNFDDN
jgi:uncharacterized zinc-type alcohol dehydrogenase-like protein